MNGVVGKIQHGPYDLFPLGILLMQLRLLISDLKC